MSGVAMSVIIPSFNGSDTLPRALRALSELNVPPGGVEFLLIDNASSDDTATLLKTASATLPGPARFFSEQRKGKSHALNAALDAADGDLLVFFDDDILPEPDCLLAYADGAARLPDAAVFCGQIRPAFTGDAPAWLRFLTDMGMSWGCTPIDRTESPATWQEAKGGNLAVRREAVGAIRFDTGALNYTGAGVRGGSEDCAFVRDVTASGVGAIYLPSACVSHIIQPHEMTKRAVFRRYYRIGLASGHVADEPAVSWTKPVKLLGSAVWLALRGHTRPAARRMVMGAMRLGQYVGGRGG